MTTRHVDNGIYEHTLKNLGQWVSCPKCQHCGILQHTVCQTCGEKHNQLKFVCSNCHLTIDHENYLNFSNIYYVQVSNRCQFCGAEWLQAKRKILNAGHLPKTIPTLCSRCHKTSLLPVDHHSAWIRRPYLIGITDYGLQLYLQEPTRHGLIFVYNPQHLMELKSFIQANLRERTQSTGNSAYYSRLPAWIKSARHRKDVLKAIARLEQKILSTTKI